ncbi:MAG: hypothetical protein ACI9UT_000598 [Flavobacteriales bacterium]|jgi:hypothetical protein
MNNRISSLMFATAISCLFLGCSQTNISFLAQISEANQDNLNQGVEEHQSPDLKWLYYADPKADANFAIEKQDFKLFAITGRDASLPGLVGGSSQPRKQCGYRLLANTDDTLKSDNALISHNDLYQYAATYNQLMAVACQKFFKTLRISP